MNKKIISSGTPHSVATNERTKNAINPRNTFTETDEKKVLESEASLPILPPAAHPQTSSKHAPEAATEEPIHSNAEAEKLLTNNKFFEPKPVISSNRQKLPVEKATDPNRFYESLHRIEDRLHNIRDKKLADNRQRIDQDVTQDNYQSLGAQKRYEDNIQSLGGKKKLIDNRQKIEGKELLDNYQDVGPVDKFTSSYLYKEKKNIQDNRQQGESANVVRSLPSLLSDSGGQSDSTLMNEKSINEMTEVEATQILGGDLGAFNEDELRAKVRQMREKLGKANQTLIDTEEKNERSKD